MLYYVAQKSKELTSARFTVRDAEGNRFGNLLCTGQMNAKEFEITGTAWDHSFTLDRMPGRYVDNTLVHDEFGYRPYTLTSDGEEAGLLYQVDESAGGLRSRKFYRLWLGEDHFEEYPVAPEAKADTYGCVYDGEEQIALAVCPWIVLSFQIAAVDEEAAYQALLLQIYSYAVNFFRSEVMVVKGTRKLSSRTKDPVLLSKFRPEFLAAYGEGGPLAWKEE